MNTALNHRRGDPDTVLARARNLANANRNDEAYACYLDVLRRDPTHLCALHELGNLAYANGYRSAARTAYEQLVHHWPQDPVGQVNLGNILFEDGEISSARDHFIAALRANTGSTEAHRGLGHLLHSLGEAEAADRHWRQSFPGQALAPQPYRGTAPAIPLLLLVSAKGGNIPTRQILDDRVFAVAALYVEYYKPDLPLPAHGLVFNAIGDADIAGGTDALAAAEKIIAQTKAPVINQPRHVNRTGRAANAAQLASLPGVSAPRILALPRADLRNADGLAYPLLLRAQGFHTGQHFVNVECAAHLQAAASQLPGETLLAIEYLDARGADGMARKYRAMYIDGALYPLHLAISTDWKVHYFTADMTTNPAHRAEEKRFLENMPGVLGASAMAGLAAIGETLHLDYAGIDFGLGKDGTILLFEANATMVINKPSAEPIWDYRRAPIERALEAAKHMLLAKSRQKGANTLSMF